MLIYLLLLYLFLPLIGLVLMEDGAFGRDIGMYGYPNGSSLAYFFHLLAFLPFFFLFKNSRVRLREKKSYSVGLNKSFLLFLIIHIIILLVMLFFFGGYNVWLGELGKGKFRSTFGDLGAFAYWLLYFITPATLAYMSIIYRQQMSARRKPYSIKKQTVFLTIIFIIGALSSMTWGSKSGFVVVFMPALVVLNWEISMRKFIIILLIALPFLAYFAGKFDGVTTFFDGLLVVIDRATVVTGNVSWLIWEKQNKIPDYNYMYFFIPALSDKIISAVFSDAIAGLSPVEYKYYVFITYLTGYADGGVSAGHSVTSTIFSEGLIALGNPGYLLFSILAGSIGGVIYSIIKSAILNNQYELCVTGITYFCSIYLSWVMGGGVVTLFHVSHLLGILFTFFLLKFIGKYLFFMKRVQSYD